MANFKNYFKEILTCVEACADFENGANQDLGFFREFRRALKVQTGALSPGNRYFLVSRFQQSIITFVNSAHAGKDGKRRAIGSPRIEWKATSPLQKIRKAFDILIVNPPSRKSVAIEIKGRDFGRLGPAMMQIGLAINYGEYLVGSFNGNESVFQ
jgi:hypothetical protein